MFEIGFWELALIALIALLVLGPERLPGVARKAGQWIGRGRALVRSVKREVEREFATEELKRMLAQQAESEQVYEILDQADETPRPAAESTAAQPATTSAQQEPAPSASAPATAAALPPTDTGQAPAGVVTPIAAAATTEPAEPHEPAQPVAHEPPR